MKVLLSQNPFGTVKSWTNCPRNCSTKIQPENKLIKVTKYHGTKAHQPCVRIFVFIFQFHEYHHSQFPRGSCSQIEVHCLTSYRVVLETNSCYWTKNSCFFIVLCCLWAILNLTFDYLWFQCMSAQSLRKTDNFHTICGSWYRGIIMPACNVNCLCIRLGKFMLLKSFI